MSVRRPREIFDRLAGGAAMAVVIMWVAYAWERSTGLTFVTRGSGGISTAEHLAYTWRMAVAFSVVCVPLALLYFGVLRPRR
jgi:hypothetical protein